MKKYNYPFLISCIISTLPIFAGILLWNKLPDQIPTHFQMDGTADKFSSKPFTVFGLPLILLLLHCFVIYVTINDPKRKNISEKLLKILFWIVPTTSLFATSLSYSVALGKKPDISLLTNLILGMIFVILGNYLPKSKQNYSIGIKTPWTLHSEENWNRTHRLGGWVFVISGLFFFLNAFLKSQYLLFVILFTGVIPSLYSFILYKKGI